MHDIYSPVPFQLEGVFGGFVFTESGKRRMLLQGSADGGSAEGSRSHLLKVPRLLRRRISSKFRQGEPIHVAGTTERDPVSGSCKWTVSRVLPGPLSPDVPSKIFPGPPAAAICRIDVCSKKNCWRNGGREFFDALQTEARARGLSEQIEVRQTGCLDRCKPGPNADLGRREFSYCRPADASALVEVAAARLLLPSSALPTP